MSFTVEITVEREFRSSCSPEQAFSLLADVPRSASHFPKVERLVDLGSGIFRWEMEKIGLGGYTLQQTIYACRYGHDSSSGRVFWEPVVGIGNASVSGHWLVRPSRDSGAMMTLSTRGLLTVDFPSFLQFVLAPIVQMEFTGMVDRYIENLGKTLATLQTVADDHHIRRTDRG